jgi:signal peptidase I
MEPLLLGPRTASTPDRVIVDRLSYRFASPKRGDVIVFSTAQIPGIEFQKQSGEVVFFCKRLVGMPGERIRIVEGRVYANGRPLGESDHIPKIAYTQSAGAPSGDQKEGREFQVGPDEYFVLGDNSPNSYDSRYWGCVPASAIHGKVTMIYYPLTRAGRL